LRGKRGQRIGALSLVAHPPHDPAGRLGIQHRFAGGHGPDRADQVGAADLLEHVPGRTGHDRVEQRFVIAERGEHQARDLRHRRPDLATDPHAVNIRQPDVEHGHIRPQRGNPGQRRGRCPGFAHDLDVRLGLQ
jgi:hypothetical protein